MGRTRTGPLWRTSLQDVHRDLTRLAVVALDTQAWTLWSACFRVCPAVRTWIRARRRAHRAHGRGGCEVSEQGHGEPSRAPGRPRCSRRRVTDRSHLVPRVWSFWGYPSGWRGPSWAGLSGTAGPCPALPQPRGQAWPMPLGMGTQRFQGRSMKGTPLPHPASGSFLNPCPHGPTAPAPMPAPCPRGPLLPPLREALGSSQSIGAGGRPAPSAGTCPPGHTAPCPPGALSRVSWATGWGSPTFSKPTGLTCAAAPSRGPPSAMCLPRPPSFSNGPKLSQVGCGGRGRGCYCLAPSETATSTPRT